MSPACGTGNFHTVLAAGGIEIVETSVLMQPFETHRHDSYVVGLTTHGVQSFSYRGGDRHSLPGQAFVIHPDEKHDGWPGTEIGYGYRAAYVSPHLIGDALGGKSLPFDPEVVGMNPDLILALGELLDVGDCQANDFAFSDLVTRLADVLQRMSGVTQRTVSPCRQTALSIRDDLSQNWKSGLSMAQIEARHGLDRFTVARLFRRHFGVSPHRYLIMRRLDHSKQLIRNGSGLADAAYASGFADQSHMSRHFLRTFGMSPGRWKRMMI